MPSTVPTCLRRRFGKDDEGMGFKPHGTHPPTRRATGGSRTQSSKGSVIRDAREGSGGRRRRRWREARRRTVRRDARNPDSQKQTQSCRNATSRSARNSPAPPGHTDRSPRPRHGQGPAGRPTAPSTWGHQCPLSPLPGALGGAEWGFLPVMLRPEGTRQDLQRSEVLGLHAQWEHTPHLPQTQAGPAPDRSRVRRFRTFLSVLLSQTKEKPPNKAHGNPSKCQSRTLCKYLQME